MRVLFIEKTRISRRYIKMPIIDIMANVTKKNNKEVLKRLIKGKMATTATKEMILDSNSLVEDGLIREKINSGNYSLSGSLKETKSEKYSAWFASLA
jgi:hypothetical protein